MRLICYIYQSSTLRKQPVWIPGPKSGGDDGFPSFCAGLDPCKQRSLSGAQVSGVLIQDFTFTL
jgi:hypothetical protein